MDPTKQVADTIGITWGLGIVSTDAATLGATALPDPAGDSDFPWLWWGDMFLRSHNAGHEEAWGLSAQKLEVDTKAMRRVKPSESLIWVVETSTIAGAPNTFLDFGVTRVLVGQ